MAIYTENGGLYRSNWRQNSNNSGWATGRKLILSYACSLGSAEGNSVPGRTEPERCRDETVRDMCIAGKTAQLRDFLALPL